MSRNSKDMRYKNATTKNRGANKSRPQSVNSSNTKDRKVSDIHKSTSNPYSWYDTFPQFTKDAGSLAFGLPLGEPLDVFSAPYRIPGLMTMEFVPTIGYSADLTSPINRSSARFYTYLRNIQKSAATYDSADIMMYIMALDSCYMFHALMRRAYGLAQLYTPVNKYYPRALMAAAGFSTSLLDNLAEFRAYINRFAISLGSYALPAGINLLDRHQWMCEGVYVDSNTTRAQTYMFVPSGFWKFNNTVETGSQLDWIPWTGDSSTANNRTLEQIMAFGDSLLNAILLDEDTGRISGDMYAAFGSSGMRKLTETTENYLVLPVYDEVVLSQIENLTVVGEFHPDYTPVISQDPSVNGGAIKFMPAFDARVADDGMYTLGNLGYASSLVNMHKDSPTPQDVVEATRLMVGGKDEAITSSDDAYYPTILPADVVQRLRIFVTSNNGAYRALTYRSNTIPMSTNDLTIDYIEVESLLLQHAFKRAPLRYVFELTGAGNPPDIICIDGDIDNVTPITNRQLAMLHEAAMLSLFNVPQMGW